MIEAMLVLQNDGIVAYDRQVSPSERLYRLDNRLI